MNETLKRIPYQTKTADVDEKGIVTVAVNGIGIEDAQHDISMPGSFVETITHDMDRMRWFLNHDSTQLLGVPLYGEEKSDNLIVTGQLNLSKQIGRDILADYKLFAEAGRTLEHSIGVKAIRRDKEDRRKVLQWKMYEYSTLTWMGANPNTYLVGLKSATPSQVRDAVDLLKMALKQKGYSDERLMNIEQELDACFKALEGNNMVVCPHCGYQFDYDKAEQTTFQQIVLGYANQYTRWIAEDIVSEQILFQEYIAMLHQRQELRQGVRCLYKNPCDSWHVTPCWELCYLLISLPSFHLQRYKKKTNMQVK